MREITDVFLSFLKLGFTSFGGPVAHLGYFRAEFVERRRWFDDRSYADLVALCQFLPGPASSQVGMGIGLMRAGLPGMFAAWTAFTLPSALALVAVAYGSSLLGGAVGASVLSALKLVAVAVVAQAVWQMAQTLAPDRARGSIAVAAALFMLLVPGIFAQVAVIIAGAAIGLVALTPKDREGRTALSSPIGPLGAGLALALFFLFLLGVPWLLDGGGPLAQLFDIFYRAGALVFGGGHLVLPLLESQVVPAGLITQDEFLAGYGAAQAVPGPLFTFSAFVGAAALPGAQGLVGAAVALIAIFLPSFFLVPGTLRYWSTLADYRPARAALTGINAAVVGLLLAALYNPVITSAVATPLDGAFALAAFALLHLWKAPPWAVVIGAAAVGAAAAMV